MDYKRKVFESDLDYLFRLVEIKMELNPQDLDWADIVNYTELGCHPDSLRKACQPKEYGSYAVYKAFKESSSNYTEEEIERRHQLKIDLQKVRDENIALNEKLRLISRHESIQSQAENSVSNLRVRQTPEFEPLNISDAVMIGGVADVHFGKELKINGLQGEIINLYNEDIFEQRMWRLLQHYVFLIEENRISKVNFFDLGDSIEGILRQSALQTIKYGIVDSTIKYADFMTDWLNELSKYAEVEYWGCLGNHDEIRPLQSKSGDFPKENVHRFISAYLKVALKNNHRITINDSKNIQYAQINGKNVLAVHGQNERNLVNSVLSYKEIYGIEADIMISGHLHNSKQETASLKSKIIQFPSIVGIDEYSMKLKKTSKAEGKAIIFKSDMMYNIDIDLQ